MTTSDERGAIIQALRDKHTYWSSPENRLSFFNESDNQSDWTPSFGIQRDNDGYFHMQDDLISYCNLRNGYVIRIRKTWSENDWTCYTNLHNLAIESDKFRIDIPKYREIINIDGHDWEYAELQSPNNDYGQNFNDDVFEWPELTDGMSVNPSITEEFKNSTAQYFRELAETSSVVLKYACQVAETNNCGLPRNIVKPTSRFKDAIGYFWSDFDQDNWVDTKQEVLAYSFAVYTGHLHFAKICGTMDDVKIQQCTDYARTLWTTI